MLVDATFRCVKANKRIVIFGLSLFMVSIFLLATVKHESIPIEKLSIMSKSTSENMSHIICANCTDNKQKEVHEVAKPQTQASAKPKPQEPIFQSQPSYPGQNEQQKWRFFNMKNVNTFKVSDATVPLPSPGVLRIVHYVWCHPDDHQFTFSNYLSFISAIKAVRPEAVYFNHPKGMLPAVDKWSYNTWFEELQFSFPWIFLQAQDHVKMCQNGDVRVEFIADQLKQHGGIFLDVETLLLEYELGIKREKAVGGKLVGQSVPSFYACANVSCVDGISVQRVDKLCLLVDTVTYNGSIQGYSCVVLNADFVPAQLNYPETASKPLHRFLRKLFYAEEGIPQAAKHAQEVVPNVAHYVWYGGGEMDYLFYLSILSVLYIVKVDEVYVYGDVPPSGPLWLKLTKEQPHVHWVLHLRPNQIFGAKIEFLTHFADAVRMDLMLKYGGVHVDPDLVFNKSLDRNFFHYDAVASLDSDLYPMRPFPGVFNLGLALGKPYTRYWQIYQLNQRYFYDKDYTWISNRVSYKIWERNPELINLDPYLQLICCQLKCYPTWVRTREEAVAIANDPKQWLGKPTAFHWTAPNPPELENEDVLRKSDSLFAQVGHNVLKAAGHW